MKNRIWIVTVAFVITVFFNSNLLIAQNVNISAHDTGWISVRSYQGATASGLFIVRVNVKETEYPKWSLMVRVSDRITNSENKEVDPSKISIRLNRVDVGPTIQEMGTTTTAIPLNLEDIFIIEQSKFPIKPPTGKDNNQWIFVFDVIVAPGAYLQPLTSWENYFLDLTFTLKDANYGFLYESSADVRMQIHPDDTPPSGPDFGFVVNADASLKFATPEDYTKQVESTENSSIKVTSKDKGYEVWVNSGDANFNGDSSAPPVNVVSVKVGDSTPITLSNTVAPGQLVYAGGATNKTTKELNVRYFITSEKSKELVKYGGNNYTTTLTYTLIPN